MTRRGVLQSVAAATAGGIAMGGRGADAARPTSERPRTVLHDADFCVIGGGMAGLIAALAAARHGAKALLMQDRPVFGGNASSEVRMHVCGADRHNQIKNMRETGILEEIRLDNLVWNPQRSYSMWDALLHRKTLEQTGLETLLNCSCLDATMDGDRIQSVTGWQATTYTKHVVRAKVFADCSGDAILAPLTGAAFRVGREARAEYGESIAPEVADQRTMGMTCLFEAREHDRPMPFTPPPGSRVFERCEDLPYGKGGHKWVGMGYWWVELGGEYDSIHDTETLRDELLRIVYGVWDHIKNRCEAKAAENWALEWIQSLPGKRESRRYVGDHVLTQLDVESEGRFDDRVAYGGWSMDDHHPAGFEAVKLGSPATVFHPAPSPYGVPYRCLYSRNVANLMFAGRDVSCTHAALSSTRVQATCAVMGQAVGTAAAIAIRDGVTPREVGTRIDELQQTLLADDAYIPWLPMRFSPLTTEAALTASQGDPEPLRDGVQRPVGDDRHSWACRAGDQVTYEFGAARECAEVALVFDSQLDTQIQLSRLGSFGELTAPPPRLVRDFRLEGLVGGEWTPIARVSENHQRLVRLPVGSVVEGVRLTILGAWAADDTEVFSFSVR